MKEDFNNYTETGIYSVGYGNDGTKPNNSPINAMWGMMVVFKCNDAYIIQITSDAGSNVLRIRIKKSTGWYEWKELAYK